MLLPLGSPLPDDSVSAKRGESGMLGGLSVPLNWGVAVPPDDYDHWAQEPEDGVPATEKAIEEPVPGAITVDDTDEWDEWAQQYSEWQEEAEPRFDVPRSSGVVPHSPAAG